MPGKFFGQGGFHTLIGFAPSLSVHKESGNCFDLALKPEKSELFHKSLENHE